MKKENLFYRHKMVENIYYKIVGLQEKFFFYFCGLFDILYSPLKGIFQLQYKIQKKKCKMQNYLTTPQIQF